MPEFDTLIKARDAIRSKRISAVELTKQLLARIEKVDPGVLAFNSVAADHALSSGPSIFFDAVALVRSAKGAELLVREAAAIDWVRDAFGHLKVIGTVEAAGPILEKAAVEEDAGVVDLAGRGGVKIFIEAARRQRVWEREPTLRAGQGSSLAYLSAKAGVDALTIGLAKVLAPKIRVFSVSPAGVDTDFVPGRSREQLLKTAEKMPLARLRSMRAASSASLETPTLKSPSVASTTRFTPPSMKFCLATAYFFCLSA